MRVQASLIINDTELFEGIVQPLKESREFNSFLVKLLEAYKEDYNGLRSYFGEASDYSYEDTKDYSDVYSNVAETFAIMDTLVSDGENLLGGAINSFQTCMDKAMEQGIVREEETKDGNKEIHLALEAKKRTEEPIKTSEENSDLRALISEISKLAQKVDSIAIDVENLKRNDTKDNVEFKVTEQKEEVFEETPVINEEVNFEQNFEEDTYKAEEEVMFVQEEQQPVIGEASSAMSDLLGSMFD